MTGSATKRKRLSDITNTVSSSRPAGSSSQFQENSMGFSCGVIKDYISQIIEENATLLKALGERKKPDSRFRTRVPVVNHPGESSKIIELSSIELQKLRVALEKVSQQNRHLTLANSQMLAELNLSKEKVKALQHELGCTMAVLKLKNSELDKDRKGLCEKITLKVATGVLSVPSVSNNTAGELDKGVELNKKQKQNKELFDDIRTEEALPKCSETATDASVTGSTSTSNPNRKSTLRNRSSTILAHQVQEKEKNELPEKVRDEEEVSREFEIVADIQRFHSVNDNDACKPNRNSELQGNEKLNRDLCGQITSELPKCKEQPKGMKVATAPSEDHSVDTNMIRKPNRKSSLRNQASCIANLAQEIEVKEKELPKLKEQPNSMEVATAPSEDHSVDTNMIRKPNRKSSLKNQASCTENLAQQIEVKEAELPKFKEQPKSMEVATAPSEDHSVDTNMIRKPDRKSWLRNQVSCTVNLAQQIEVKEEEIRIRRKSSRKRSSNLEKDPCESREYLFEIVDADIPGCSVEVEPSATSLHASSKHEADEGQKEQSASSQCQTQVERRTSVGRPMRKAAEKVSSYKEMPLKTKMRRQE